MRLTRRFQLRMEMAKLPDEVQVKRYLLCVALKKLSVSRKS